MSALVWMIPGRRRLAGLEINMTVSITRVAESAPRETLLHGFGPRLTSLWWMLCDQAENTVYRLVVRNDDGHLNWGLKGHRGKVDSPRLVAVYW
jgi:hypothetical protein